jgi:hypothetical protein
VNCFNYLKIQEVGKILRYDEAVPLKSETNSVGHISTLC